MVFLIGEIAGKKNKLALFTHREIRENNSRQYILDRMIQCSEFRSEGYSEEKDNGLEIIQQQIAQFLQQNYSQEDLEPIYGVCLGVTAPVERGNARIERSSFKATIKEQDIRSILSSSPRFPVAFLNDMEAIGYGIFLGDGEENLTTICNENNSINNKNPRTLMLLSTGLGEALWYWNKDCGQEGALCPIPSEGGHTDFSDPTSDKELSKFLEREKLKDKDNSPISYEYVLSRDGLCRIYNFLRTTRNNIEEPPELTQLFDNQSTVDHSRKSSAIIIQQGSSPNSPNLCEEALNLFIKILGARAGSLALQYKASGGVFICDDILIPTEKLQDGIFEQAFINKEKGFKNDNQKIPVKVFKDPNIVLWGAAKYALEQGFISRGKLS